MKYDIFIIILQNVDKNNIEWPRKHIGINCDKIQDAFYNCDKTTTKICCTVFWNGKKLHHNIKMQLFDEKKYLKVSSIYDHGQEAILIWCNAVRLAV